MVKSNVREKIPGGYPAPTEHFSGTFIADFHPSYYYYYKNWLTSAIAIGRDPKDHAKQVARCPQQCCSCKSAVHGDLTAACRRSVILRRTGLALWHMDVSREKLRTNCAPVFDVFARQRLRSVSHYQSLSVCRPTIPAAARTADGLFLLLARLSGTPYRSISEIRTSRQLQTIVKDMAVLKVLEHLAHYSIR